MQILRGTWSSLLDFLAPLACPLCGGRLTADWRCPPCGLPADGPLRQLRADRQGVFLVMAGGAYLAGLREVVHAWKFRADPGAQRIVARSTARALGEPQSWDALVPVPAHRRRLRERGWEPAGELALAVGRASTLPVRRHLLRVRDTPPLTGRPAAERRLLVRAAFRAKPTAGRILVVDDVATTGATFRACRQALLAAGARSADLLVAAATPRRFL